MGQGLYRLAAPIMVAALLAGCNSTEQALAPSPSDVAAAGAAKIAGTAGIDAETGSAGTIRFTPVIGAPVGAVTPLSRQLAAEAKKRGFAIRSTNDQAGDHILKGYFSAFSADGQTTIVYVWDVLDPAGNRLHRIQGQETVPAGGSDPWASVPPETMAAIATKTFDDYQAWLGARGG